MPAGPTSYLQKIQNLATTAGVNPRTKESKEWYAKRMQGARNLNRLKLLGDPRLVPRMEGKPQIGHMYMFMYDPKGANDLLYYDTFPLILMVGPAGPHGFHGINLHYLPIKARAIFFDKLMQFTSDNRYDEKTRVHLSYRLLSSTAKLAAFAPCFKKYLFSQLDSKIFEVHPSDWELALYLPSDNFVGQTRKTVWQKSSDRIASAGTTKTRSIPHTSKTSSARISRATP
jgi:hypothetical protein